MHKRPIIALLALSFLATMFVAQAQQPPPQPPVTPLEIHPLQQQGQYQPPPLPFLVPGQVQPGQQVAPAPRTPPIPVRPFRVQLQPSQNSDVSLISVSRYLVRPGEQVVPVFAHPLYNVVDRVEGVDVVVAFMRYGVIVKKGNAYTWDEIVVPLGEALRQVLAPMSGLMILPPASPAQLSIGPINQSFGTQPPVMSQPTLPKGMNNLQKLDQ